MATVTARKVDDSDYAALSELAQENGRSLSEEVRILIADHVRKRKVRDVVADMLDFAKRNPMKLPDGKTSLDLLHEERGSW